MSHITRNDIEVGLKDREDFITMVAQKKYCHPGESSFDDVIERVVREFTEVSKYTPEENKSIANLLRDGKLIPAGSILYGLGNTEVRCSLSNCYLIKIEEDSLEGIFEAQKKMSRTFALRGGVGLDLTILRPKLSAVNNAARTSSGAVSFMPLFSAVTQTVGQLNRRGASLISLDIRHPDALDFIWSKADPERVFGKDNLTGRVPDISGANISLKVTDDFMKAYENNEDWEFIFPDIEADKELYNKEWDGNYDAWLKKGYPVKSFGKVPARQIFKDICEANWSCGDPGMLFIDRVQQEDPASVVHESLVPMGTNPCFSGDTLIATSDGPVPIKELVGKEVTVFDGNEWVQCDNFRVTGEGQQLLRIHLSDGTHLDVTPYHTMYLEDGSKLQAKELKPGDRLEHKNVPCDSPVQANGAYLKGFLLAEGHLANGRPSLTIYEPKYDCFEALISSTSEIEPGESYNGMTNLGIGFIPTAGRKSYTMQGLTARKSEELVLWCSEYKKRLPQEVFQWDRESKCKFLAGLFDGDGTVMDNSNGYGYQLSSIYYEFLVDTLRLMKSVSVYGKISLMKKAMWKNIKGKDYYCQDCWRITVPQSYSIEMAKQIPFSRLKSLASKVCTYGISFRYGTVLGIEPLDGTHTVYCCTVPTTHKVQTADGIITGQCGEQPLGYWNNCLLAALVLHKFVHDPWTDDARFDWDAFDSAVWDATFFLDMMSDINIDKHPLAEQRDADAFGKRIGLEFTGLADALAMLNIKYGSADSLQFCERLTRVMLVRQIYASGDLAERFGCCGAFEDVAARYRFIDSPFIKRLSLNPYDQRDIINHGLRNVGFNTVGPCGSISIMAGNCSSGIEPIFKFSYQRATRLSDTLINCIHGPALDHVKTNFSKYENMTLEEVRDSLNYVEADAVSPSDRIAVQAAIQKYISASISSTTNLPREASAEQMEGIYHEAWKAGLKGITVFRDGCKDGVLISKDSSSSMKKEKQEDEDTLDLPSVVIRDLLEVERARRHRVLWKGAKMYVIVSLDDDDTPVEVFAKLPREAGINGGGVYSEAVFNEKYALWETITRLVSLLLRSGIPLEYVIKQLDKGSYSLVDASAVIARILRTYLPGVEAEEAEIIEQELGAVCSECGKKTYVYENGCGHCLSCGYTTCG